MFAMIKVIFCIFCMVTIISEITAENEAPCQQTEPEKRIRESSSESNSTKPLDSEKIKEEEANVTHLDLPNVINSTQITVENSNLKNISDEASTEKELLTTSLLISDQTDGGKSYDHSSITASFGQADTKNDGNLTARILDIVMNSSTEESEKIHNLTKKENLTQNVLSSESNFTKPENTRVEESVLAETTVKNVESLVEKVQPIIKARRQIDNEDDEIVKNEKAFLKAYKNCKLVVGEHYLRMSDKNPEKVKKCVVTELRKLESFEGQYTKLLDNSKLIRRL